MKAGVFHAHKSVLWVRGTLQLRLWNVICLFARLVIKRKKKKPTQVLAFSFLFCFFNLFFSLSKCAVSTCSSVALPLCSNTFNPPRCLCSGLRRRARSLTLCSRGVAWQFDVQGHYSHICSLLVQSARTHSNSQRNVTIKKNNKTTRTRWSLSGRHVVYL